jgi:DNA-binding response OmpR family regulator
VGKKKVLLIDDEEDFTTLLKLNLERSMEYEAWVAPGGEAGLRLIQTCKPDLVLLDLMMPGLDRLETLKRIKATTPDLPVAMVTAVWNEEEANRCFEAGAYEYITKPVDLEYLKNTLLIKLF